MSTLRYVGFGEIDPYDFIPLLNNHKIRKHLVDHEVFDARSAQEWIDIKKRVDSTIGCKVRAIVVDDQLSGWCGIQLQDARFEIAIVLDDKLWGLGKRVFNDVFRWAKTLGHHEICIHLIDTRPEYRFLRKISRNVCESELLGRKFKTYQLAVE